jgi:hypothetical protein
MHNKGTYAMIDMNKLLGQLLGSGAGSGFAGGLAGGLAGSMMSGKAGRKLGGKVLKLGGLAAVGALAYTRNFHPIAVSFHGHKDGLRAIFKGAH